MCSNASVIQGLSSVTEVFSSNFWLCGVSALVLLGRSNVYQSVGLIYHRGNEKYKKLDD